MSFSNTIKNIHEIALDASDSSYNKDENFIKNNLATLNLQMT